MSHGGVTDVVSHTLGDVQGCWWRQIDADDVADNSKGCHSDRSDANAEANALGRDTWPGGEQGTMGDVEDD